MRSSFETFAASLAADIVTLSMAVSMAMKTVCGMVDVLVSADAKIDGKKLWQRQYFLNASDIYDPFRSNGRCRGWHYNIFSLT